MGQAGRRSVITEYRLLIALGAIIGYACAFPFLRATFEGGAMSLSVLPVVAIAWSYGFRPGLLAGFLSLALNTALLALSGPLTLDSLYQNGIPGTIMLVVIGGTVGWTRDLQRRLRAEVAERQRAEEELRAVVDSAPVGIALAERGGAIIASNAAIARILGYDQEALRGRPIGTFAHPDDAPDAQQVREHAEVLAGQRPFFQREKRFIARDGRVVPVRMTVAPVRDARGAVYRLAGIVEDVTAQKEALAALGASEERLRMIINNAPLLLFAIDAAGYYTLAEGSGFALFGDGSPAIVGRHYAEVCAPFPDVLEQTRRALAGESHTVVLAFANLTFEITFRALRDERGAPGGIIGVATEIAGRTAFEERLNHQAHHDPLTDLPNRLLFSRRLDAALVASGDGRAIPAILFLDLDRFKVINDSLGHDAGDQLLRAVAGRLLTCVRPHDTVARFGGDEFTILLTGVTGEGEATRVAERITAALDRPFLIDGHEVVVTTSIGVVLATRDGGDETAADFLRYADMAMYRAKEAGKARHALFDRAMSAEALARLELETELRRAVEREEFSLAYQPQVDLATGTIVGVEALVRWEHPTRGSIAPGAFIPVAEETGLIVPLGRWVLATACRQARAWQEWLATWGEPPVAPLSLCINLSTRQFQDPQLVADIAAILAATGLAPRDLHLEITETVVMAEEQATRGTLRGLQELGVHLVIDDFGAGSSSLRYLKRFPVGMLKIDRAFVAGLGQGDEDDAIVAAVVALGRGLGVRICAEGVETAEQAQHLRRLGCDLAQGYHFALPVTAAALGDILLTREGLSLASERGELAHPTSPPDFEQHEASPAD